MSKTSDIVFHGTLHCIQYTLSPSLSRATRHSVCHVGHRSRLSHHPISPWSQTFFPHRLPRWFG
ncbi:hypothetical protein M405DRAFT_399176 [Rhizopogon salebrosus TDB-379]|nr:hypothetical protein M405DRAFT_399176 [Rhizopogon salebrosus TDB-379]